MRQSRGQQDALGRLGCISSPDAGTMRGRRVGSQPMLAIRGPCQCACGRTDLRLPAFAAAVYIHIDRTSLVLSLAFRCDRAGLANLLTRRDAPARFSAASLARCDMTWIGEVVRWCSAGRQVQETRLYICVLHAARIDGSPTMQRPLSGAV